MVLAIHAVSPKSCIYSRRCFFYLPVKSNKEADSMYRIIGIIIVTTAFLWWIYRYDQTLKK